LCAPLALRAAEEQAENGAASTGVAPYVLPTVWAIVSFVLVLLILTRKLFPVILQAMDKRAAEIRAGLEAADKARAEAAEMMKRHQADLDKARLESAEIIDEAKRDALKLKDAIVASARKESEEITARSRREIELAKVAAISDLHRQAVRLSIDIAGRLISKNLNAEEHAALIEERLKRFKEFQVN
jgi:F-type H+-transporting ATPase subunit b